MSDIIENNIVRNGLVLDLDAVDRKNYPGKGMISYYLSKNQNDDTLTPVINFPAYYKDNYGNIILDSDKNYISVDNSTSLQFTSELTLSIWVYINAAFNEKSLITKGPTENDYDYMMYLTTNSTNISFYKKNSSGIVSFTNPPARNYINRWANIVITFDGVNVVQYDNSDVFLTTTFVDSEIRTSFSQLRILSGWDDYASVNLSMVQIYNRALTSTEVLQNYNATKSKFGL